MSGINFNRDKIPDLKKYLPTFEEAEFYKKIQREYKKQTEEQSLFPGDDGRSRSEKALLNSIQQIREQNKQYRESITSNEQRITYLDDQIEKYRKKIAKDKTTNSMLQKDFRASETKRESLEAHLDTLNKQNSDIMDEILEMKENINLYVREIEGINKNIKDCERKIQIEKVTTEHIKDVLKKTLSGKTEDLKKDEEEKKRRKREKMEKENAKKISVDKFLAIMQALKNEKEIGKFKID